MARVVVVASSDVPRAVLDQHVRPGDEVHVVVAAVEQSRLQWLANDDDEARTEAARVGRMIEGSSIAAPATVDVKVEPPSRLVRDAVAEHDPDAILVVLREGDDATWLEDGELAATPRRLGGVPITRIRIRD